MNKIQKTSEHLDLMKSENKMSKLGQSKYFVLAFIFPFLILGFAYAMQGIFPFGEKHILTIDLYHQYAPFLRELRAKLISGDSLFVSWSGGLGFNFYSVITYYLASPFNFLLLLFKEQQISDAVLLITLFKIASSGLTFYTYSYFSRKKHSWFYLAISCAYALSGYSLAYSWNIMWLDTLVFLPLTILGLIYLIRNQRIWLYIVSLSAILISNYYTAFFVCVFLLFYFWVLLIQEREVNNYLKNIKNHKLHCFVKFAGSSLLAAGIAAVTLVPTIIALSRTSASGDLFPDTINFFEPFIDFISRLLTLAPLSIRDGMPNLYASVILLVLLPLFFSNKKISFYTKVSHGILIFFLLISLNNNVLNFIWHGFHYPNQLPFRNSFVLIFLFCVMALTAYDNWQASDKLPWFRLLGIWIVVLLFLQKIDQESYDFSLILISIILLFIFALILNTAEDIKIKKKYISLMLLIVMLVELLINTTMAIGSISDNEYYGSRDGYLAGEYPESVLKRVEQIKDQDPNARAALWPDKCVNDPMLYGFPGLTIFSSTYPKQPVQLLANLGYDNNRINSYQDTGSNIILDSVLGIKYKIIDQNREEQISFYQSVDTDGITALYKNEYALPLLYYVPHNAVNLETDSEKSGIYNQRELIKALNGNPDILQYTTTYSKDADGCTVVEISDNKYQVDLFKDNEQINFSFELKAEQDGYQTVSWDASGLRFDQIYLTKFDNQQNNQPDNTTSTQNLSRKSTSIADIGYLETGETVKINFVVNKDDSNNGNIKFEGSTINQNKLETWLNGLRINSVNPLKHDSNHLTAEINLPQAGYLLFATTYDQGWQVSVNELSKEITPFDNSLILIPVDSGNNQLELKFTPNGFVIGVIISGLSLCIAFVLLWIALLRKRKKNQELTLHEQNNQSLPNELQIRTVSIKTVSLTDDDLNDQSNDL